MEQDGDLELQDLIRATEEVADSIDDDVLSARLRVIAGELRTFVEGSRSRVNPDV